MKTILLTTLNAKYAHTALGLRYIYANMKDLQEQTHLLEFTINDQMQTVAEEILSHNPSIVGIGVYIWNAPQVSALVEIIKKVSPHTIVVLGGPEVSYEPIRVNVDLADFIVSGEGDEMFYTLCSQILANNPPHERLIKAPMANIKTLRLPYEYYSDDDIAHRTIYVEASRGCPFLCEFCLSSLDQQVRNFPLEELIAAFDTLWERGVRHFKFIDRTFNINVPYANALLDFFLTKQPPYFLHFEVIPDHFPETIKNRIKEFPPASLQFEVGIQTLNPVVAQTIKRKLNVPKIKENLTFLENETKTHLHVDLIIGLPGESLESFGKNLDELYAMTKSEIQLGILKKLSGTTLDRHDEEYGMRYSDMAPYDLLCNNDISYFQMQEMKRFARFWDLVYNSGNFRMTSKLLWPKGDVYEGFGAFARWIYGQTNSTWQISLDRLSHLVFRYLTEVKDHEPQKIADSIALDVALSGGRTIFHFLKEYIKNLPTIDRGEGVGHAKRQAKHSAAVVVPTEINDIQ